MVGAGDRQYVALFRYGAVVLFGVNPLQETAFLDQLSPFVREPYAKRETEDLRLRMGPASEEQVAGGEVLLQDVSIESLQVIADALAKARRGTSPGPGCPRSRSCTGPRGPIARQSLRMPGCRS